MNIRQLEREMAEVRLQMAAGSKWGCGRRLQRLERMLMEAKFARVRKPHYELSPAENFCAAQIDATVEHFPSKSKVVKLKPVVNFRARDFEAARRVQQQKKKNVRVQFKGIFKLGEVMR